MEGNCLVHRGGLITLPVSRNTERPGLSTYRAAYRSKLRPSVVAVMAKPENSVVEVPKIPAGLNTVTAYPDSWFDRLAIRHLSQSVQDTTGLKTEKEGYESLIEAASMLARRHGPDGQQNLVIQALKKAFPALILKMIRVIMPPSRLSREYFARFTTVFFPWLIGYCEVRGSEFEGRRENNVVYIPKCRFLEGTSCVGMCTNLCKIPSQKFIHESLGMPVHMVPNFEDMSCEMIFGQHPPEDDPALKQPCYKKICKAKQTHGVNCSS